MIRARGPLALGIAGLLLHAALLAGAGAALPAAPRVALAFAVLVMIPGLGWLRAIGATPPGGAWLASGWALGLGVGWLGAEILVTRALHLPFTVLARAALLPDLAPWALAAWRAARERPGGGSAAPPSLGRAARWAVLAAALFACVHVARIPTPVSYYSDSPDHVGTIRRMMAEGDAFPTDAFFRDAGPLGADPRKGLWHPGVATIATLARADALATWWALAALLAPLFALNAAAFAFLVGGSAAAAVGAWALVLTYGGSMAVQYLREAVFATKLADQLALATATAVLADIERRRASTRRVAVGLALGAVATHVFAALQFAVVFGALGVGLLVRDRGAGPSFRRLFGTALALGLACLPYLLWRAHGAYAPNNVIHTEPQGLMILTPGVTVISIGVLWDWFGKLWVLFPLSAWAWARASARPAVLYLLTTSIAVALLQFCPPVVALLQPRLGYLLMRFTWLLPLAGALAFAIPALLRAVARPGARRVGAAVALAGLAALLLPVLADALDVTFHARAARERDGFDSVLRWRGALAWMDANLPRGSVVLSDPATSYSIPMLTRDWVTTLVDQHSSPDDSLALTRILDARDALDPYASWARTREVIRRWGATAIALNDRFAENPRFDYWAPSHEWFAHARARLDGAPSAFRRVYDSGDFVVYRIVPGALDTLGDHALPRPYVRPAPGGVAALARAVAPGMPALLRMSLAPAAAAGDSVAGAIEWTASRAMPPGSYWVAVRFDRPLPAGVRFPAWCAKPARKLYEVWRRERFRFRGDHLPVAGGYGVDLWRPGTIVSDTFAVVVPRDVAPGDYQVQVVMVRQPHYPNFRLSDYFFDHDYYSGLPVGVLRVAGRRAS